MSYGVFTNSLPVKNGINPGVLQVGVMEDVSAAAVSGGNITVWSLNTLYPWDWTPAQLSFTSTSAADTLAGTGAQRVLVEGLDENLEEISETLDLSGVTPAVTVSTYARVNSATCLSGSGGTNAGSISGKSGADTAVYIHTEHGHSMQSVFTVPLNWKNGAILHRYWADRSSKQTGAAVSRLYLRTPGTGTWQLVGGFATYNSPANYTTVAQVHVPPGTDIHGALSDLDTQNDTIVTGLEVTKVPWRTSPYP